MAVLRGSWRAALRMGLGLVLVLGGFGTGAAHASSSDGAAALVVHTDRGTVAGMYSGDARAFLGIPYAAPPIGALRWRPPQPAARWSGVRQATQPGSACAQTGSPVSGVPATTTSEDCLYLNVYTPRHERGRRLPVMVWIHGGAFTGGTGSDYDGAAIAAKGDVIVVTINYRLSAFGFLALPALDNEGGADSSGDFGLLDQQAALRWVQHNAAAFGGDARNVTEFGESAGAASVCANMASPPAAGLFARAIAESGCLIPLTSRQAGEVQGAALAASLGCADPAAAAVCLRAKPAADILTAEGSQSWSPTDGGPTLPLQPPQAFIAGRYNHVPLLQGTNHDEGRFFVALQFDAQGSPLTAAGYPGALAAIFGPTAVSFIAGEYPLADFASPDLALAAVQTDGEFACPALLADRLAAGSGVYGYEFSDPSPPNFLPLHPTFPLGAAHSLELQYVFQRVPLFDTVPSFTPAQLVLSDQIIRYWTAFAATGNPNGGNGNSRPAPGLAPWPAFTAQQPQIQELVPGGVATVPAADFATDHRCAFWSGGS